MVSLSRSTNTTSGGATFFSESGNMEDREFILPILESYGVFKPLKTIPPISLHFLATLLLEVIAVIFAVLYSDENTKCKEYFIIIYIHVALWFLTLIIDQVLRLKHYGLRINGYLEFYKKTQVHHRLPLYIVSLWTTAVLLIQTLMQHLYSDSFVEKCIAGGLLSPKSYISALITLEFFVVSVVSISYIFKVRKFNKQKPPPDVQKEEWNACSSPETFARGEIGYRQLGDKVYDFLEKQADLIRHLKDHNARLGEKLMILNAQMRVRAGASN